MADASSVSEADDGQDTESPDPAADVPALFAGGEAGVTGRAGWTPRPSGFRTPRPSRVGGGAERAPGPAGAAGPDHPGGAGRRMIVGRVARGLGELLITAGLVVLLFLVYQLWITDMFAARTQDRLHHQLDQAWGHPPPRQPGVERARPAPALPPVDLGDGLAILRVPRFGLDYSPVIVQGVSAANLRRGPGHIPGTALPGQLGNFVVSGHRTTYGKPFSRLDELKVGDPLVVEVRDRYYTYRVTGSEVVTPNRLDVTYPVPGRPDVVPTRDLITLTTCHPRFSASHRLIVYGELADTTEKSAGLPPVLKGA